MRHVALLRAINVGGRNLIPMTRLRGVFTRMGFADVATYIASGNVLFTAAGGTAVLERRIEVALAKAFRYDARVLVRSRTQLRAVADGAPEDWPRPDVRCNVLFLKAPLTPQRALGALDPKPGVDMASRGPGVVYVGTRKDRLAKSGLPRIVGKPAYKLMTVRTFGTCEKLLGLIEG